MQPVDRLHALDAVRAYALLLGVVLHAAASFLEGFPIPQWRDEPAVVPAVLYYVIHMFRMSAFFLIAGFFARMVVERRGVRAFVTDRAKRIALPLVVGLPVVSILSAVGLLLGAIPHGMDFLLSLVQAPAAAQPPATVPVAGEGGGGGLGLGHLWFLYYLLIFYVLTLGVRAVVHAVDASRRLAALCDRVVAFLMRGVWGPVLIAAPIALYFWQLDAWSEWIGLPAPFQIVPQGSGIIGYGIPFALGWLLHRQMPALLGLRDTWHVYLALAVALTIACLSIVGTTPRWQGPTLAEPWHGLYTAAYMVGLWCWIFALVGAALRFLSEASPVTRYLADASYWIYLVHLAAILFFITLMRPYDWHWAVKLTIMLGGSMPLLLLSYHVLVRFTWIGAILNGRRHERADRVPRVDAAPAPG